MSVKFKAPDIGQLYHGEIVAGTLIRIVTFVLRRRIS
jgi:hypothetical protein